MDNLDFGELSDDQLIGLIRAALQEAVRRHPAVEAAAKAAVIEEAEKARIVQAEVEKQAAILRAKERERIAKEAAARVQAEHSRQNSEADRLRAEATEEAERAARLAQAKADAEKSQKLEARRRGFLSRAAAITSRPEWGITLVVYKQQVFINEGSDRFDTDHLAAYRDNTLKTIRSLMSKKPAILELCTELRATYTDIAIIGSEHFVQEVAS